MVQLLSFDTTFRPASQGIFLGKRIRTSPEALDFTGVSRLVLIIGYWHTFATHALASGVDAKTLSGILGHTQASFTLDTYTHVTGDMQRQAAQVMDTFMTDIFGKELAPWQREENQAAAAST